MKACIGMYIYIPNGRESIRNTAMNVWRMFYLKLYIYIQIDINVKISNVNYVIQDWNYLLYRDNIIIMKHAATESLNT